MQKTKKSSEQRFLYRVGIGLLLVSILCISLVGFNVSHWRLEGFEKEFHAILIDIGFLSFGGGGCCILASILLQKDSTRRIVHLAIINTMLFLGGIVFGCVLIETFLYVKYHDVQVGGVISPSRYTFYPKYYQLNQDGFRDTTHALPKPKGRNRIVVVGDSFSFGAGVKRVDDLYFKVLESELQHAYPKESFESVSIAKKGWNTAQEFEAFRTQGLKYDPDLVILGYVLNDAETQEIKSRQSEAFHYNHLLPYPYGKFLYANSFAYFITEQKVKALPFLGDKSKENKIYIREIYSGDTLKQHERILRDFLAFIHGHDLQVIVVLFPDLSQMQNADYPYTEIHQFVGQTIKEAGAEFLDLFVPLQDSGITNFTVSEFDYHPNEEVHRIAGTELFMAISEKGLLPRPRP